MAKLGLSAASGRFGLWCLRALMSGILLQSAGGADGQLLRLTREHHRNYAEQHGLEYLCLEANPAAPKRAGWAKIPIIISTMQLGFRRIVWLDASAVVCDVDKDLSQVIDAGIGMVRHPGPDHWSSGVMVVVSSQATYDFFQAVHAEPENASPWMEQLAINALANRQLPSGLITRLAPAYHCLPAAVEAPFPVVQSAAGLPFESRPAALTDWLQGATRTAQGAQHRAIVRAREDFGEFLNSRGLLGEAAEIGVQRGLFSRTLLDHWQGNCLHLIDPWQHFADGYQDIGNVSDAEHEACLQAAQQNLAQHVGRYRIHRKCSLDAVAEFADESLDFAYVDANHSYLGALEDMRAWFPKVKPGGVFAGHDYLDGMLAAGEFGVKSAVRAFELETGLIANGTLDQPWPSWYLTKPAR
jgi:hypothetical protein